MAKTVTALQGEQVTDAMLQNASTLFSENYGAWGSKGAGRPGIYTSSLGALKPIVPQLKSISITGSRVRMSAARLRAQYLPPGSNNMYVMVTIDGVLAGNAFACRWEYAGGQVCWITQLVVHSAYRERRLATTLLLSLIDNEDDAFGVISSHPAACKALAKAVGGM
jgi:hypothetical protein